MQNQKERQKLLILENIEKEPDTTQADLAAQLGIAVGSVNWYLKRLIKKGYIKVTRLQRRRLRYLITPQGIAEKSRLTASFLQTSLHWYRETRESSKKFLAQIKQAGYDTVCIQGDGDLAEIIYLSCLEAQIKVEKNIKTTYPIFKVENFETILDWPEQT